MRGDGPGAAPWMVRALFIAIGAIVVLTGIAYCGGRM